MRRACVALWLIACPAFAHAQAACPAPGEPVQWIADYCMLEMQTDDEIAVSGCLEEQSRLRFASACESNTHFKKLMCEQAIRSRARSGTVADCVRDADFKGRTVEHGGVP